jgi:hypothetical protein
VDKVELRKLQEFLRKSLGNQGIKVTLSKANPDDADVHFGERRIGVISVDDEDGDRSFAFAMKITVERPVLQDYLRRKNDSVELMNGKDFIGVISADDPQAKSFTLQMAILDIDLEEF